MYAGLANAILKALGHEETKTSSYAYDISSYWKRRLYQHAFLQGVL